MNSSRKEGFFRPRILELFGPNRPEFTLGGEISAGLTVGLIALPLALALGIAAVPAGIETPLPVPALGIITAVVAGSLISLLGGSRVQIGGPTAAFVPIILMIVSEHGYTGLLVATIMAGIILVLMGIARMGTIIKFIPWPVTSGFTTGIAVAIMLTQLPDFFCLGVAGPAPRDFFDKVPWLLENIGLTNPYALLLAAGCVALILIWPRLHIRLVPGPIVAMVGATVLVVLLGWDSSHGVATIGSTFGSDILPSGLPAPSVPVVSWGLLRSLVGPALTIAVLGAVESLLSAVVADGLTGERHDSNTELIAQGIANIVTPFFGGLPATGAIARTSANISSGGRTPLAGVIHALTILVVMLAASSLVAYVPMAAIAAVLVVVAVRMGEWYELSRISRMPRSDAMVLVATFVLTVVFDLVVAIQVGMVLAAVLFIKRVSETTEVSPASEAAAADHPSHSGYGKEIPQGVLVYSIVGPFLFGAAEKMESAMASVDTWPEVLILRLRLVTAMDTTGLNALKSVVERMKRHHGTVILSGLQQQPLDMLLKAGFTDVIGRENLCTNFDEALARAGAVLTGGTKG